MTKIRVEKAIGDGVLSFETGWLAKQSAACVICQFRETVVLNAVTTGTPRPGTDFFPLTCDYRERTAAAGKFPGGFIKREGRPTTKETLTSRLIDRPVRPMFAPGFMDEVQVTSTVLASDRQTDGDIIAMNGAAAALYVSPLPFEEAVASVRLGLIDGEFIPFPTHEQLETSELDLIVSGTKASVTMIEGFSRELSDQRMLEAIEYSHGVIRDIIGLMQDLCDRVRPVKNPFEPVKVDEVYQQLKTKFYDAMREACRVPGKQDRADAVNKVKEKALAAMIPDPKAEGAICSNKFNHGWHD